MRKVLFVSFLLFLTVGLTGDGLCKSADETKINGPFKKKEIRKRVEILRMWGLTRALDLNEKIASKLFPLLHKYDKKKTGVQHSIREDIKGLKLALEEKSEAQIKSILTRLKQKHKKLQELNDEEMSELKDILTIEQQAKYVLFQHKFTRDMRKIFTGEKKRRFRMDRTEKPFSEKPFP